MWRGMSKRVIGAEFWGRRVRGDQGRGAVSPVVDVGVVAEDKRRGGGGRWYWRRGWGGHSGEGGCWRSGGEGMVREWMLESIGFVAAV